MTEDISIPVSSEDSINVGQLSLSRASAGLVNGAKQQMNDVSSWIDGSVIYGNDVDRLNMLRTLKNG